jgi:lysozyme family protein
MALFDLAIPIVLQHEGGYVHDPDDAGGETNFGICRRSYPNLDLAHLTRAGAAAIYHRDFWTPLQLDHVRDQQVATKLLDTAVLIGRLPAIKFLQRAVQNAGGGIVPVDGHIGPATLKAVNDSSPLVLLQEYRHLLATFYEGLVQDTPTSEKFLKGWLARANA